MQNISSVVQDPVAGLLNDLKSYSDVVTNQLQATQPLISQSTLQKVVKTVVQAEDRAKNLMVFGLKEVDSEDLHGR